MIDAGAMASLKKGAADLSLFPLTESIVPGVDQTFSYHSVALQLLVLKRDDNIGLPAQADVARLVFACIFFLCVRCFVFLLCHLAVGGPEKSKS